MNFTNPFSKLSVITWRKPSSSPSPFEFSVTRPVVRPEEDIVSLQLSPIPEQVHRKVRQMLGVETPKPYLGVHDGRVSVTVLPVLCKLLTLLVF